MRTALGDIRIFDPSAVVEVRTKLLGLSTALGFDSDTGTRMATIVSDLVRHLLTHPSPASLYVDLEERFGETLLELRFLAVAKIPVAGAIREIFDEVSCSSGEGSAYEVTLRKVIRALPEPLTPTFLDRERHRINLKSRAALLEELREKNQQLEKYNAHLEELVRQRTAALELANQRMKRDLDAGAEYVASLIPPPMESPIVIDWRYVPSEQLGGDAMGYHWLDDEHLAIYLLDVTGHGLDSALLAVSIINVVRGQSLPDANFHHPGEVLQGLNESFTMEKHGNKLFTIWYAVYHLPTRTITWAGGGHPEALLYEEGSPEVVRLKSQGPLMGMVEWPEFTVQSRVIARQSRLYLYSDGVFEIHKQDGSEWTFDEFVHFMSQPTSSSQASTINPPNTPAGSKMDELHRHAMQLSGSQQLEDDFSILQIDFPA